MEMKITLKTLTPLWTGRHRPDHRPPARDGTHRLAALVVRGAGARAGRLCLRPDE
jgi:hypothetical protein